MSVDVVNESGVEVDEAALVALASHVLDAMAVHPLVELSLLLVDTSAMTELHEQWMGASGPTDVLAFPMDELRAGQGAADEGEPALLGDVALCPQVAADQAATAGQATADELHMLCTHGILHLLGYDHEEPEEKEEMFGLQAELLAAWRGEHHRSPRGSMR